jgi:[ribosomal protein S18]-alanine N-acetyltransferase
MSALLREPSLRMRPMEEDDMVAVLAVERGGYPYPWTEGNFRDCLRAGYCCWVLEQDGRMIGHGVLSVAVGEAHVLNVCVHPDCQGRGLGRRILDRLLRLAREHEADTAFLEVRASNTVAQHLYESAGFNEIGVRRGYYPAHNGREDAVVYAKALI